MKFDTCLIDKLKKVDLELIRGATELWKNKAKLDSAIASIDIVAGYLDRASEAGVLLAEAMVNEKVSEYAIGLLIDDFEIRCMEFKRAYSRWKLLCP